MEADGLRPQVSRMRPDRSRRCWLRDQRGVGGVPAFSCSARAGRSEDVHCALAWVKANAQKYNFDVNRVILYGVSAGGRWH